MPKNIMKVIGGMLFAAILLATIITPATAQERCHSNVNKVAGSCVYYGATSTWQVKINLWGYKVVFQFDPTNYTFENKEANNKDFYPNLSTGTYTYDKYEWVGNEWVSRGTGTLTLEGCVLEHGSASVSLGACVAGEPGTLSTTTVNIVTSHATVTIAGGAHTTGTINLSPGNYPWTWAADPGYWGNGTGILIIDDCIPKLTADASFVVGACAWGNEIPSRQVIMTIEGATVWIYTSTRAIAAYGPFTSSQTITIPCGLYTYEWEATAPGYEGSGSGTLDLPICSQSEALAQVKVGACSNIDGKSLTLVSIWFENAIFTLEGTPYIVPTEIKMAPGEYVYSWEPISQEYNGSGEGVLTIDACDPKSSEDPKPDVAAGGSGPTVLGTLALPMASFLGLVLGWKAFQRRTKED